MLNTDQQRSVAIACHAVVSYEPILGRKIHYKSISPLAGMHSRVNDDAGSASNGLFSACRRHAGDLPCGRTGQMWMSATWDPDGQGCGCALAVGDEDRCTMRKMCTEFCGRCYTMLTLEGVMAFDSTPDGAFLGESQMQRQTILMPCRTKIQHEHFCRPVDQDVGENIAANASYFSACRRHLEVVGNCQIHSSDDDDGCVSQNALSLTVLHHEQQGHCSPTRGERCLESMPDGFRDPTLFSACRRHERVEQVCGDATATTLLALATWLAEQLEVVTRSLALMSLLGLFRLLVFAVPKKGGTCNADNMIHASRSMLRGAPLCLVFAANLVVCSAMQRSDWNRIVLMDRDLQIAESIANAPVPLEHSSGEADLQQYMQTPPSPGHMADWNDIWEEGDEDVTAEVNDALAAPWHIAVAVHSYQRQTDYVSFRYDLQISVNDFIGETIRAMLWEDEDDLLLMPVSPPPRDDHVVLLKTHTWCLGGGLIPAYFDLSDFGRPSFMAYFTSRTISTVDIREILGPDWVEDAFVMVGNDPSPLLHHEDRRAHNGILVRLGRARREPAFDGLGEQLRAPYLWARDVDVVGMPFVQRTPGWMSMHGIWGFDETCPNFANRGGLELRRLVGEVCGINPERFRLQHASAQIWSLSVRGRPIAEPVGVHPLTMDWKTGFFLDARELGYPVKYLLIAPLPICLNELLREASIERPQGWDLRVRGTTTFVQRTETMLIGQAAVVVIEVKPFVARANEDESDPPVAAQDGHDDQHNGDASTDEERSRTPRRHEPADGIAAGDILGRNNYGPAEDAQISDEVLDDIWNATLLKTATLEPSGEGCVLLCLDILQQGTPDRTVEPQRGVCGADEVVLPIWSESEDGKNENPPTFQMPVPISIADAVGPPCYDVDAQCLRVLEPSVAAGIQSLLLIWDGWELGTDLGSIPLHENTEAALSLCTAGHWDMCLWEVDVYTDGSEKHGQAAFAIAAIGHGCIQGQWSTTFLGAFGGKVCVDAHSSTYIGARSQSASDAELSAIAWAALWLLGFRHRLGGATIRFRFDALLAGRSSEGAWSPHDNGFARHVRQLLQLCEGVVGRERLQWRHVKAHSGQPFNELVDVLAESFRMDVQGRLPGPPTAWHVAPGHVDLTWANLVAGRSTGYSLPALHEGVINWTPPAESLNPLSAAMLIPAHGCTVKGIVQFTIKSATINVQTAVGKYPYFEQQMVQKGINVAFLQESKCKPGLIRSEHYLRYASDAATHWGAEVWIARKLPIARSGENHICVDEANVALLSSGPRHMSLLVKVMGIAIAFTSLHYPQQCRPAEEADSFHQTVCDIGAQIGASMSVMGLDGNARLPTRFQEVTGDLDCGCADKAGSRLAATLAAIRHWVPTTDSQVHSGHLETWTHTSGKRSRIDYFAVSDHFRRGTLCTSPWPEFDTLNSQDDHEALLLMAEQNMSGSGAGVKRLRRGVNLDLQKLSDPDVLKAVESDIHSSGIQYVPWWVDVNTHAQAIQDVIHCALKAHLPVRDWGPRSSYISDKVWRLRELKQAFKKRTLESRRHRRLQTLRDAFCQLRGWYACDAEGEVTRGRSGFLYEVAAGAVGYANGYMRRQIRADKTKALQQVVSKSGIARSDEILSCLHRMQLGARKPKSWSRALPELKRADGSVPKGRIDLDQFWLDHFSTLEMGDVRPTEAYLRDAACPSDPFQNYEPDVNALLSLSDIEDSFRASKLRKSTGLDNIPGEILKALPGCLAAVYQPLMSKSVLHVQQPTQWRGGVLAAAYKRSGSMAEPGNYRALFVSSAVGKAYHRAIRWKLLPAAEQAVGELHYGAKRGAPVVQASQALVLFEQANAAVKRSTAYLFLDTQSAYYAVIRQLAYGHDRPANFDAAVVRVLQHFDLPPACWHELVHLIDGGGVMGSIGVSGHLRAVTADLHHRAFFVSTFADGTRVSETHLGTRPGEALSDLVFTYVYHFVLQKIQNLMREHDCLEKVALDEALGPWRDDATDTAEFMGPTWADDSAFVAADESPGRVVQKIRRIAESVVDIAAGFGLTPNFKKGKTEILLAVRGKNSRAVKKAVFGQGQRHLTVITRKWGPKDIGLVNAYTHLGCVLEKDMCFDAEGRKRAAMAAASFERYRSLVFQNPGIPAHIRGQVFGILVESTFFNLELWTDTASKSWQRLELAHAKLLRRIFVRDVPSERLVRMRFHDMCLRTGHFPLHIQLRSRRLRYMITLIKGAPRVLWAIIKLEGNWADALISDLAWLRQHDDRGWPGATPAEWPQWWHRVKQNPGAFRRAVQRAAYCATLEQVRHDVYCRRRDGAIRDVARQFPELYRRTPQEVWFCGPCRRVFHRKAALACHMFKCHQRKAAQRYYTQSAICPSCQKDYQDTSRLHHHLAHVKACWSFVQQHGLLGDQVEPGTGSWQQKQYRRNNPIMCPPQPSRQRLDITQLAAGNTRLPADNIVHACVQKLGAWLDDEGHSLCGSALFSGCAKVVADFPLYPDEYKQAVHQVFADVEMCFQERAISWDSGQYEAVQLTLQHISSQIDGHWLCFWLQCNDEYDFTCQPLNDTQISELTKRIGCMCSVPQLSAWLGFSCRIPERTHQSSGMAEVQLVHCSSWEDLLSFGCDASRPAAIFANLAQLGEAETTEKDVPDGCSTALGPFRFCREIRKAERLTTELEQWRELWKLSLQGVQIGCIVSICGGFLCSLRHDNLLMAVWNVKELPNAAVLYTRGGFAEAFANNVSPAN